MGNKKNFYFVLLFFSAIFWGSSFVFTKYLLETFSPVTIIFIRSIFASAFLLLFCFIFLRKHLRIDKKDSKTILTFSFLEPFLYFLFETYSLKYSSASVVSIIIATIPLFTALLSRYYFKESFTRLHMAGAFLSLVGIAVMLFPEFSDASFRIEGILLAFGAVLAAVGYGFYLKKLPSSYHPVVVVTFQNVVGAVLFLPLFLILSSMEGFPKWADLTSGFNLFYLIILAVFCSSLAFIFFLKGLQNLGLGRSNIFTNLIPVVTAVISFFLLHEEFRFHKFMGMLIVITGIFMVQKK